MTRTMTTILCAALAATALAATSLVVPAAPANDADKVASITEAFARAHAPHMDWARVAVGSTAKTAIGSASAEADWAAKRCDVAIDPALVDKNWGATDGSATPLQFVSLHEMGHCHLYSTARLGWRDAGYKGAIPEGLLDELWAMDATVMGAEDRGAMNWFGLGHEAFADAFAMAWLIERGAKPEALAGIVNKRESESYGDRSHNVGPAGRFVVSGDWAAKGWSAERAGRAAAAIVVMGTGFSNLLMLDAAGVRQTVATGWCQWTQIKEGDDFARAGYNYFLGRVGPPASEAQGMLMSGPAWATPLPSLAMPRFALAKLRAGVRTPQEAKACVQEALVLLRERHPG